MIRVNSYAQSGSRVRARSWNRSKCSCGPRVGVDLLAHRGEIAHPERCTRRARQGYARGLTRGAACARTMSSSCRGAMERTRGRRGRSRDGSRSSSHLDHPTPARTASIVIPISMPKPRAKGSTSREQRAARRARWPRHRRRGSSRSAAGSPSGRSRARRRSLPRPAVRTSPPPCRLARPDRLDQAGRAAPRLAQVAVAEQISPARRRAPAPGRRLAGRGAAPPPLPTGRPRVPRARRPLRHLGGAVGRAVVGRPRRAAGEASAQAGERRADALALVAGGDDGEVRPRAMACRRWRLSSRSRQRRSASEDCR